MSALLRMPSSSRLPAAFTLAESVISMGVLVVLVGGLGSAVVVSTRALPANATARDNVTRVDSAAGRIAEDMRGALWFIERTPQRVTFTVPDRNADGVSERISYSWDGTPGSNLMRSVNGGTAAVFVPSVDSFAVSYETAIETETFVAAPVECAETVLRSYRAGAASGLNVQSNSWWGEYFRPTLPADALCWKVTRVAFYASSQGTSNGVNSIELRTVDASNLPTSTVLAQQTLNETDLSGSFARQSLAVGGVSGLSPTAGLCLIARYVSGSGTTMQIEGQGTGVSQPNSGLLAYNGSSWSARTNQAMSYEITGTYTQPGGNQTMQRTFVTAVGVSLSAGGQPASGSAKTLNRPEALSACWITDFTQNPTLDENGDGYSDWEARGSPINLTALVGHSWTGTQKLYSTPDCSFNRPTHVKVCFAASAIPDSVAEFAMPFAWTGGTTAGIVARLTSLVDGTQTLTVSTKSSESVLRTLVTVTNLSSRMVELGLRLDPTLGTVNIETDGRSRGTFSYDRYTPVSDEPRVTIVGSGGGGLFECVSIRVAE